MKIDTFVRSVRIARPADEVFAWHERPGAFARLQPPWERVEVLGQHGGIRDGARVNLRTRAGPLWTTWEVEHRDYRPGVSFRDVQIRGPFARWEHVHRIEPLGPGQCRLHDEISYALPLGPLGRIGAGYVRAKLDRMFAYRHALTKADLEHAALLPPSGPLRVLITGASGLVGRALVPLLTTQGHTVVRLVRGVPRGPDELPWNPAAGTLDLAGAGKLDAVVHLAGAGIADRRWGEARKAELRSSRVDGTRTLALALAALPAERRPKVLVSASAVGYYGDTRTAVADEHSPLGGGFLADICRAWEEAAQPAQAAGIRTVLLRTGVVLTPAGGALAKMLPAFRAGGGGVLGNGRQGMSWISLDDLIGVISRALTDDRCVGPLNAVAPEPCTNADFTRTLGRVLRRPAIVPVPAFALRLLFGQMADETLLADSRVRPARLNALGHRFRHARLEEALRYVLGREEARPPS